jgi:hypothetical protein
MNIVKKVGISIATALVVSKLSMLIVLFATFPPCN